MFDTKIEISKPWVLESWAWMFMQPKSNFPGEQMLSYLLRLCP